MYNKADLHLHTTASDGSDTPRALIEKARGCGIDVIAVTDHDTLVGSREAVKLQQNDVKVITGIEFSCHHFGECDFDCHILGYGFDTDSPVLLEAIKHGREMRLLKLEARLKYLNENFEISFPPEDIKWLYSLNSVAKPQLARLLINRGYATGMAEAIDKYLKGSKFPDDRIDSKEAIEAIKAAGGIPVYAHPIGGEREKRLSEEEVLSRIEALKTQGLMGLECYYSRYSDSDEAMLVGIADRLGLLVSGGSDYHGENKTVIIGTLRSDEEEININKISVLSVLLDR